MPTRLKKIIFYSVHCTQPEFVNVALPNLIPSYNDGSISVAVGIFVVWSFEWLLDAVVVATVGSLRQFNASPDNAEICKSNKESHFFLKYSI